MLLSVKWSFTGGDDLYKRFPIVIIIFISDFWYFVKLISEGRWLLDMRGGLNWTFDCICLFLQYFLFVYLFLTEIVFISLLLQNMCVMCLLDQILLEELLSQIWSIRRESFLHF